MRPLAFAAALLALAAAPVRADPAAVADVLQEARLFGTWGVDCNAMASSLDWEQIVLDAGVPQSIVGGDDSIWTYEIVDAEILLGGDVRMTFKPIDGPNGDDAAERSALSLVYRVERDRQMTWHSRRIGGQVLIAEGLFADGETRSDWYYRCPNGIPTP